MPSIPIPTCLDELTPAWLTAALHGAGVASPAVVDRTLEPLGAESGFLCQTVRVRLAYAPGAPPGPPSVVAKLPSGDPRVRAVIHSFGFYEREAKFYATFSHANPLRPPRCYFAAFDELTKDTAVLLEDISDDLLPDDGALELSPDLALEFAVRLAAFHARHWGRPTAGLEWLVPFVAQQPDPVGIAARWERLQQRNGAAIPAAFYDHAADFVRYANAFAAALSQPPCTIVHGDLRVGNVLPATGGLRVVDWQTVAWGRGGLDLGFFLTQVFTPEQRRALEPVVVPAYHAALLDHGVKDFGLEDCWRDYRLGHLRVATMFVQAGSALDMSGPRAQRLLAASLERAAAAMADLRPFDVLRDR